MTLWRWIVTLEQLLGRVEKRMKRKKQKHSVFFFFYRTKRGTYTSVISVSNGEREHQFVDVLTATENILWAIDTMIQYNMSEVEKNMSGQRRIKFIVLSQVLFCIYQSTEWERETQRKRIKVSISQVC